MRNELVRKAERSAEFRVGSQNSELRTPREALFPAEERKREMTPDSLKICFVASNQRRADAAGSHGNQHIEGKLTKLAPLVVLTTPHDIQQLAGVHPMRFSGRDNPAPIHQIHHEPKFEPRPRATKQLMQHDSRAANHVGSLEKRKGEATSSEVLDIDRGVQDG
jgi:hypothetical protein